MTIQAVSADGVVHEFPDETDTGVIGKAMRDYAASNLSVSGDLKGGLHDLGTSVSQGLGAVGATGAADFVKGYTPDAPAGPAPSDQLAGAFQHGDWGNVPGLVGHSLLRAAPSAAPIIGAAAVGGPLAAGAAAGALALGPEAYGRAANNGRSEPTTSDTLGAIPGALGEAVGGALLPGESKFASPLMRGAARVGKEAAGGAIMDASGQLGASVGTSQGASFDPYQAASAAVTQGALGAARSVPDVVSSGVKSASDRAMASTLDAPANREDAESVIRSTNLMDQARQNDINTTGKARPDTAIANTVKQDLMSKLTGNIRDLRDVGLIDQGDYRDLSTLIGTQAFRGNNTISAATGSLYGRLGAMDLPDPIADQLKADVRDLNTLSTQSFVKNTVGPFQAAGKFLGKWGGTAAELAQGNLPGAAMATLMGHPAGKLGGAIGAGVDQMMGTNTPPIVLQRLNAARALRNMGFDPNNVPATGDVVSANPRVQALRTPQTPPGQPDPATGLPPNPVPVNTPIPASTPTPQANSTAPSLPPLRVDTPQSVQATLAQDAATAPGSPSQRLQAAQATLPPGEAPPAYTPPAYTPPPGPATGLPMTAPAGHPQAPLWERLAANGNPAITRQQVRDAATAAHGPDALAVLDAHNGSVNIPQVVAPIQAQLGQGATPQPTGTDRPVINSPQRYQAAVDKYHLHVANDVARLTQAGQAPAAHALLDIAVNHHTKAAKQAARAALPPEIGSLIPDYVVNQGGA